MKMRFGVICFVAVAVVFGFSNHAMASGFALAEQSVSGLGNAFAGGAASAEDATTVWFNPAGMTRIEGKQVVAGLHIVKPKAEFNEKGSILSLDGTPGSLGTNEGGDAGGANPVPNLYYVETFDTGWSYGLGINVPFGLSTEYDSGWIGRYHGVDSEVKTININPSAAHKLNDNFSYGFGISIQYIDASLTNAVDFGTLDAIDAFGLGVGALGLTPGSDDGFTDAEADSWGFGFNLGFLYEFDETKRIGFAYRSRINQELEGDVSWTVPAAVAGTLQPADFFTNGGLDAEVDLPSSVSLSYYQDVNDKLAFMADISWTEWSVLDKLVLEYADNTPSGVTTFAWDDSFRYSVGVSYQYNDQCKLRGGLAYDETPIPDEAHRGVRVPGEDRFWMTLGLGHKFSDTWSLDAAYAYIITPDDPVIDKRFTGSPTSPIQQEDFVRGQLYGEYDANVNILSLQVNYNF